MHIYDVLSFLFGSRHRPFLRSEVRSKKSEVWAAWRLSHCIHSTILTIIGRYIGVISLDRLSAVNCFNSRTRELCGHNFWSYLCSICSLVWRFQGLSSHISLPTKILNDTPSTMQVSMSFHSGSMDIFCLDIPTENVHAAWVKAHRYLHCAWSVIQNFWSAGRYEKTNPESAIPKSRWNRDKIRSCAREARRRAQEAFEKMPKEEEILIEEEDRDFEGQMKEDEERQKRQEREQSKEDETSFAREVPQETKEEEQTQEEVPCSKETWHCLKREQCVSTVTSKRQSI